MRSPGEPLGRLALLAGALAFAFLPHASRFPPSFTAVLALALALRLLLPRLGWNLPGRWLLLALTFGGALWTITRFRPFFGSNGAIALLAVMTVLKLYEFSSRRDRVVAPLLGYVLAATRFIYDQTPLAALWMLGLALVFTYLLADFADEGREMSAREKARLTGWLFLWSAPAALLLFLVFPRAGAPLIALRGDGRGITGLSERMSPGSVTSLALSDAVVFRARLEDAGGVSPALYWRGPVLEEFDGVTWTAGVGGGPSPSAPGVEVRQSILAEPGLKWLTPLDRTLSVSGGLKVSPDGEVRAPPSGLAAGSYDASSGPAPGYGQLAPERRTRLTRLPAAVSSRVAALARSFGEGGASGREAVRRALAHFTSGNFVYTLKPAPLGSDPVEDFLFRTREGFCEHYASAFTLLLRLAGIPARVVTGYLGGEYNPFGGHWIVQELHAHAWTEAWLEGEGWVRLDPTAAVSPERVLSSIDREASLGLGMVRYGFGGSGFLGGARNAADYFGFWWNHSVVGFGQARQRELLGLLGVGAAGEVSALIIATVLMPLVWLVLVHGALGLRARRKLNPADRVWVDFLRRLARRGIVKDIYEPPLAFAERAGTLVPGRRAEIMEVAGSYLKCRYSASPTGEDLRALRRAAAAATRR